VQSDIGKPVEMPKATNDVRYSAKDVRARNCRALEVGRRSTEESICLSGRVLESVGDGAIEREKSQRGRNKPGADECISPCKQRRSVGAGVHRLRADHAY